MDSLTSTPILQLERLPTQRPLLSPFQGTALSFKIFTRRRLRREMIERQETQSESAWPGSTWGLNLLSQHDSPWNHEHRFSSQARPQLWKSSLTSGPSGPSSQTGPSDLFQA